MLACCKRPFRGEDEGQHMHQSLLIWVPFLAQLVAVRLRRARLLQIGLQTETLGSQAMGRIDEP